MKVMGEYMKYSLGGLLALLPLVMGGCSFYDTDDESSYAPSVEDVAGCWLSTENIGAERWITIQEQGSIRNEIVIAAPSKTCVEFCVGKDSSFSYVAKYAGSEYFPDYSAELNGTVAPTTISFMGTGGEDWKYYWDNKETGGNNYADKGIRLVGGKLSGIDFYLKIEDKFGGVYYSELDRKFSRTDDKKACNGSLKE
jgi:hypothetical protein